MKKTRMTICFLVSLCVLVASSLVMATDFSSVNIYVGGAKKKLGTLGAIADVTSSQANVVALFDEFTSYAVNLDIAEGWDFRWIAHTTVQNSRTEDIEDVYIVPPYSRITMNGMDKYPFFWNTDDGEWSSAHTEGVDSYIGIIHDLPIGSNTRKMYALYLVLYNKKYPKTVILPDSGFAVYFIENRDDVLGPMVTDVGSDSELFKSVLELTMQTSGFGKWTVIPTCSSCGFDFSDLN